jgi:hypothetical protein
MVGSGAALELRALQLVPVLPGHQLVYAILRMAVEMSRAV